MPSFTAHKGHAKTIFFFFYVSLLICLIIIVVWRASCMYSVVFKILNLYTNFILSYKHVPVSS